jgi:hypothetical protein
VLASVDTKTFRVTEPASKGEAEPDEPGSGVPWLPLALGAATLLLAAAVRLASGRRSAPPHAALPADPETERPEHDLAGRT